MNRHQGATTLPKGRPTRSRREALAARRASRYPEEALGPGKLSGLLDKLWKGLDPNANRAKAGFGRVPNRSDKRRWLQRQKAAMKRTTHHNKVG